MTASNEQAFFLFVFDKLKEKKKASRKSCFCLGAFNLSIVVLKLRFRECDQMSLMECLDLKSDHTCIYKKLSKRKAVWDLALERRKPKHVCFLAVVWCSGITRMTFKNRSSSHVL